MKSKPNSLFRWIFAPLVLLSLTACSERETRELSIDFALRYQGAVKSCLPEGSEVEQLAFYWSDPHVGQTDHWTAAEFTGVHPQVHLVRFLPCAEAQTPQLTLKLPPGDWSQLKVSLGVPFALNHQNPAVQPAPLNVGSMFWTWRLGYKFLRLDMADWSFHLGSGGCKSPSSVRPPETSCEYPNLKHLVLPFDSESSGGSKTVLIDLDRLVGTTTVPGNCMDGFYQDSHCNGLIQKLGLDSNSPQQNIFYWQ